ncbi:MAG: porin, partial [Lutibacter sp.]|nr:porin [Lutibacter sp.]
TLELVVRYNEVDLNDSGANIFGGLQKDISVGLNYHVNKSVKFRLNYSNIDLDEYALNGKENLGLIQTRLQFAF